MIDKELLTKTVTEALEGSDNYLVDIHISPANEITVEINSDNGVDIDTCAALTRRIEDTFDRDTEDYELEVGSAGITSPFKVRRQYIKNIGNDVEILTRDGRKLRGKLVEVAPGDSDTDVAFTVEVQTKVKEPGMKRPEMRAEALTFSSADCKYVRYDLKF